MSSVKTAVLILSLFIVTWAFGPTRYGHAGFIPQDRVQLTAFEESRTEVDVGTSTSFPADREYQYKREYRESRQDTLPPDTDKSTKVETFSKSTSIPGESEYQYKRESSESHLNSLPPERSERVESFSKSETMVPPPIVHERDYVFVEREPRDHSLSGWWHRHLHPED